MMLFPPRFWDHSRQQNCKRNSTENSQKPRQLPPRLSSSLEKDQTRKLTLLWHHEVNHRRRSHILSLSSTPFFYSGTQWTVPDSIYSLVISLFCPLPVVTSVSALLVSISTFVKNATQVFCGCPIRSCFLMTRQGLSIWRGQKTPQVKPSFPRYTRGNKISGASLVVQMVRGLPAVWETQVRSLHWEDSPEKKMATHSSILAWRIPRTEEPGALQSMRSQRVGHDWLKHTHKISIGNSRGCHSHRLDWVGSARFLHCNIPISPLPLTLT